MLCNFIKIEIPFCILGTLPWYLVYNNLNFMRFKFSINSKNKLVRFSFKRPTAIFFLQWHKCSFSSVNNEWNGFMCAVINIFIFVNVFSYTLLVIIKWKCTTYNGPLERQRIWQTVLLKLYEWMILLFLLQMYSISIRLFLSITATLSYSHTN